MASTIPLAKPHTPAKLVYPVALSRKIDGVPVKFTIVNRASGEVYVHFVSRQGETLHSVSSLVAEFAQTYIEEGLPTPVTFVGEVHQRNDVDAPFKETSGIVRRQYDQSDQLAIALFDTDTGMYDHDNIRRDSARGGFEHRLNFLMYLRQIKLHPWVKPINQHVVHDEVALDTFYDSYMNAFPHAEGMVARAFSDPWAPGKRTWGYQKLVKDPMIDLRIVGFEEGKGKNAGAVGRMIAMYKGEKIGIGPGKLTYTERAQLWVNYIRPSTCTPSHIGSIAQIKHKVDPSYDALRQPTFQCWRPDKDTPDA